MEAPPENIEKITRVYRNQLAVEEYSSEVPFEKLGQQDFKLNIRRLVDNSTPAELHDVRALLHGGVAVAKIDLLTSYFDTFVSVRQLLFKDRDVSYPCFRRYNRVEGQHPSTDRIRFQL